MTRPDPDITKPETWKHLDDRELLELLVESWAADLHILIGEFCGATHESEAKAANDAEREVRIRFGLDLKD